VYFSCESTPRRGAAPDETDRRHKQSSEESIPRRFWSQVSKKLSDIVIGNQPREPNRSLSTSISCKRISAAGPEQPDHFATAARVEDGYRQWTIAEPILPVHVRTGLQQSRGHIDMKLPGGQMQWSKAVGVSSPEIGA
jgi:hypothetical protein